MALLPGGGWVVTFARLVYPAAANTDMKANVVAMKYDQIRAWLRSIVFHSKTPNIIGVFICASRLEAGVARRINVSRDHSL